MIQSVRKNVDGFIFSSRKTGSHTQFPPVHRPRQPDPSSPPRRSPLASRSTPCPRDLLQRGERDRTLVIPSQLSLTSLRLAWK